VRVEGVGRDSIQGDVRFADALEQMGATITKGDNWIEARSNGVLKAIDADFNHIPDAAMTIAVAALYADGTSTLRNIASWRVKETDRLAAMATELRKVGAIGGGGRGLPARDPAGRAAAGHHRHLRRPPDGDVLLAGLAGRQGAARQRDAHQRSEVRGQDLSRIISKRLPGSPRRIILKVVFANNSWARGAHPTFVQSTPCPCTFRIISPIPVITIDGPTASGKGTVAHRVADHLGFHLLDSGALYRLTALSALRREPT
jgi:hypothetical protein